MKKNDIVIAISFWVNSIKDIHNIPVKKSEFKVVKLTEERVYLEAVSDSQKFDCPLEELSMFHPTGEDCFTGIFIDENDMREGFGKLYREKASEKLNALFDEVLPKNEKQD